MTGMKSQLARRISQETKRLAPYVRPDELNLAFNFLLIKADWNAEQFRSAIDRSLDGMAEVGAPCTSGLCPTTITPGTSPATAVDPSGWPGLGRTALLKLALPGAVYLYNGEELGLPNVDDLPDSMLQHPTWERSGHTDRGRDGERVPLPWSGSGPPFGFTSGASTWLPMPESWARLTVQAQLTDPVRRSSCTGGRLRCARRGARCVTATSAG